MCVQGSSSHIPSLSQQCFLCVFFVLLLWAGHGGPLSRGASLEGCGLGGIFWSPECWWQTMLGAPRLGDTNCTWPGGDTYAHRCGDPMEPEMRSGGWGGAWCRSGGILISLLYCSVIQQLEFQSHYWSRIRPDLCHQRGFFLFLFCFLFVWVLSRKKYRGIIKMKPQN